MNFSTRYGMLSIAAAFAIATGARAQPVSYSRQIAPILAMNCNLCHGANPESAAGGLSTRTVADLNRGGNLGPVIVPGEPERSPLYQFISGARGEPHRMPLGGPPLTAGQVDLIRRWILEGAKADADVGTKYTLELPSVAFGAQAVRIGCRVPTVAYVELELVDPRGHVVYADGGGIQEGGGVAAIGEPGKWISWSLRRAPDWPAQLRVRLTIAYAASQPGDSVLLAADDTGTEWAAGDAEIRIASAESGKLMRQLRERLPEGLPDLRRWQIALQPGLYRVNVRYLRAPREASMLFRVP